jgi:polysaccharide pyruvyl transferase WcaK-like protein
MHEPSDRALAEEIRARTAPAARVAPPPEGMGDVLRSIAECDALVGMRLHALLLAANAGIPVLAWSYDPKVDALADRLGNAAESLPVAISPEDGAGRAIRALRRFPDMGRVEGLRDAAMRTAHLLRDLVERAG